MSAGRKAVILLRPGDLVGSEGRTYRIKEQVSLDSVLATDLETNAPKVLKAETLTAAPTPKDAAPASDAPALEDYTDEEWAEARRRLSIITPLLMLGRRSRAAVGAAARKHDVGITTLYRWINAYESSEQLTALIPGKRGRPAGLRLLAVEQEVIIEAAIRDRYLKKSRPTEQEVVDYVQQMCRKAGTRAPNHNTIRARIHAIPKGLGLRRRGRADLARGRYEPLRGRFPGATYPLAVVQIDHTPGDVILVDERTRKPLGRPWLTLAIDVNTRMVVGLHVSFDNPSFKSVGACIAQAICTKSAYLKSLGVEGEWPVWGLMSSIHVDNGKDFRSKGLIRACENYCIDLQWRPVGLPEYGGHIERLMGTVANELAKIPGKTFANTRDRKGYDPESEAVMTLREFEQYFVDYLVNVYHKRLHTQLGVPPLTQWQRGIEGGGEDPGRGMPPLPADPERLRIDFLPYIERTVQRYGVQKDHIKYYDPVLDPYINAKDDSGLPRSHCFRYDPRDISVLYFMDPGTKAYVRIPYADLSHPPISEWERRAAVSDLQKQGRAEIEEDALFATIERLRARIEEAAQTTKSARRALTKRPMNQPAPARPSPAHDGGSVLSTSPVPLTKQPSPTRVPADTDELADLFSEPIQPFDVRLNR
jgi:putative transposase